MNTYKATMSPKGGSGLSGNLHVQVQATSIHQAREILEGILFDDED